MLRVLFHCSALVGWRVFGGGGGGGVKLGLGLLGVARGRGRGWLADTFGAGRGLAQCQLVRWVGLEKGKVMRELEGGGGGCSVLHIGLRSQDFRL